MREKSKGEVGKEVKEEEKEGRDRERVHAYDNGGMSMYTHQKLPYMHGSRGD